MIFRVQPIVVCPVHTQGKVKGLCLEDKLRVAAVLKVFLKDRAVPAAGPELVTAMPWVPHIGLLIAHSTSPPLHPISAYEIVIGNAGNQKGSVWIVTLKLSYLIGKQIFQ